jgi:hypothetical protein
VRAAQRVVPGAPQHPPVGQVGVHRAVHDPEPGQAQQRFQPRPPDVVLEGGDLDVLRQDLVGVTDEAFQPAHVSMWLAPATAGQPDHPS